MIDRPVVLKVSATFGPLSSHGGLKNWRVAIAGEALVFVPLGILPSLLAGLGAGMGGAKVAGLAYAGADHDVGPQTLEINPRHRVVWRDDIAEIFVKKVIVGASELWIVQKDKRRSMYGIGVHTQTERLREVLKSEFADTFRD